MRNETEAKEILRRVLTRYPGFGAFFKEKVSQGKVQFMHGDGINCGCLFVWLGVFSGEREKFAEKYAFARNNPEDSAIGGYSNVCHILGVNTCKNGLEQALHDGPANIVKWIDEIEGSPIRHAEPSYEEFIDIEKILQEIEGAWHE